MVGALGQLWKCARRGGCAAGWMCGALVERDYCVFIRLVAPALRHPSRPPIDTSTHSNSSSNCDKSNHSLGSAMQMSPHTPSRSQVP